MADLYSQRYNPDVLSCIANLSNDEVFTPPEIVNNMLDMLPQELFETPETTFLDPACKSGVFLREITKRLLKGLEKQIPDRQERIDHILHKQVFGIAITEMTSLLSRRSLYCSKYPNCKYSISQFDDVQGNIRFKNTAHRFINGRCVFCGASKKVFGDNVREDLESHAYEFIHTIFPEELFNMKFDVIISNPPYQLTSGGGGKGSGTAIPIYNLFVDKCKKLSPKYMTMIIPSRWYSGGRGLEQFRKNMLEDARICKLVDFYDSRECFPGVDIAGGVCYFLWDNSKSDNNCVVENHFNNNISISNRPLNEYSVFIRNNLAVDIVKKVTKEREMTMAQMVNPVSLYGFNSNSPLLENGDIKVRNVNGIGYCKKSDIRGGLDTINKWKVIISAAAHDHGGQPDKDGKRRILSRIEILEPNTICTATYIVVGSFNSKEECESLVKYLKTQFVRFLLSQVCISQHISRDTFKFVPQVDLSVVWTDEKLCKKYGLSNDEIDFINSMIRPMESNEE